MPRFVLVNAELLDPEAPAPRQGSIVVEDGRIVDILAAGAAPSDARPIDLTGRSIAPGFIDLHHHGELIFCAPDALAGALERTADAMTRRGTTAFLPTTITWSMTRLREFMTQYERVISKRVSGGAITAEPLGLHLEGPWISPEAAGAQPSSAIRAYNASRDEDTLTRAADHVRLVTLAPEIPGTGQLLDALARHDIVAALGHSRASKADIDAAVTRGMTHVTHLFNAMGPMHQREPGVPGTVLADDRLTADLICDGAHVHPSMVVLAARAKRDRLILITDRITPTQMRAEAGAGFEGRPLTDDGAAFRFDDGTLAGSRLTLEGAISNAQRFGAMDRLEAVAAATLRPARVLGIEAERGTLRRGARADFAVLDGDAVVDTWVGGRSLAGA